MYDWKISCNFLTEQLFLDIFVFRCYALQLSITLGTRKFIQKCPIVCMTFSYERIGWQRVMQIRLGEKIQAFEYGNVE